MKEVTIKIEEDAYGFYLDKAVAHDDMTLEDFIAEAVQEHYEGEIRKESVKQTIGEKMHLQINLNIKSTLAKSPFADTEKLSKEIAKVIERTEKELNKRNIPHCSEYIVNIEGHMV